VRLFRHQFKAEQRLFWRSSELAFFTFLLPIIFLFLLGYAYGDEEIDGVRGYNFLLAGMLGYGVAATSSGLAIILVLRREAGTLKRLRATPLPPATYIAAALGSIIFVFVIEATVLVALARVFFAVPVPDRIVSLALAVLFGASAFAAMGVALTTVIRSADGASAVINAVFLPLTFISGSFFSPESFPSVLQTVAEILPLKHFIVLVRDIVLESEGIWSFPTELAVIAAWGIACAFIAARRFQWEPREGR
jgi:ABC-2 type transport system permease protein